MAVRWCVSILCLLLCMVSLSFYHHGTRIPPNLSWADVPGAAKPWVGVHVQVDGQKDLEELGRSIPNLAKLGVNALIVQVDYNFSFPSHPELESKDPISPAQARAFGDLCRANGIRPIPSLDCLGHQSWGNQTKALLTAHPELDETPGNFPNNEGLYCRSWCPLNPETDRIVFALLDDLLDAFGADAFHVGMDEVTVLGADTCPRCRGKSHAELFARQVNDLHEHLVNQRHVTMLMWGDRLLDQQTMRYPKFEASENGTAPAVDMIPRDIVICDWHYSLRNEYWSVPFFLQRGFRVWPTGWDNIQAAECLMNFSLAQKNPRVVGYLSSTWRKVPLDQVDQFTPTQRASQKFAFAKITRVTGRR